MNSRKIRALLAISAGTVLGLCGLLLVALYFAKAVFARLGEADQSLLYWYLPFLLFGLIGLVGGSGLAISGYRHLKSGQKH